MGFPTQMQLVQLHWSAVFLAGKARVPEDYLDVAGVPGFLQTLPLSAKKRECFSP